MTLQNPILPLTRIKPSGPVDRHEFDGKLPDWSKEGLKRQIEQLKAQRKEALAFNPALLSESQRFERNYLIAVIDGELFWLDKAEWPYKNPRFYLRLEPSVYIAREYAPLAERMRAYTEYAEKIPTVAEQIRNNLRTRRENSNCGRTNPKQSANSPAAHLH